MNTFGQLITKLKNNKMEKKSCALIRADPLYRQMSKYVKGGLSKMGREEIDNLIKTIDSYESGKYMLENKEIKPNDEQNLIIKAPIDRNVRVIAGAGTGKTTTICCRIKYLLDQMTTPDKILVLTFNVEARKNLEKMICRMMGFELNIEIRTIDSFCRKLVQTFSDEHADMWIYSLSELGRLGRTYMEKFGSQICASYGYVFFDEFQDVDSDQFHILRAFVLNGCRLTVIGDDSQNIYQFRGSDNQYIINFDTLIPRTTTYQITTNYRSTPNIIELANDSIRNNVERIDKTIRANISVGDNEVIPSNELGLIELHLHEKMSNQMRQIIDLINMYVDKGVPYHEIAILSRNKTYLKEIETELSRLKIPYCALIDDKQGDREKQQIDREMIVLSTIHRAKGLEWTVVCVCGLQDTQFPSQMNNNLKNIEEERRLFYVACTRAKRYLYFIANNSEFPLCRFLKEIKGHFEIRNHTKTKLTPDYMKLIFDHYDKGDLKKTYSVMDCLDMLSSAKLNQMRNMGLLPKIKPTINVWKDNPLHHHELIKKNAFESDFGIYCDYVMTRELMRKNGQVLMDCNVENILYAIHLTDTEKELYEKYQLDKYFESLNHNVINLNIPPNDIVGVQRLIDRLVGLVGESFKDMNNVGKIINERLSDFHYPPFFMNRLQNAYDLYRDPQIDTLDILESIYYISLCPKFNNDRRRLVYRSIHNLFELNSAEIIPRIAYYIETIAPNNQMCKINMAKKYKFGDTECTLCGELDYVDLTNNVLIDIKCSEKEYSVEWYIQTLIYYALLMERKRTESVVNIGAKGTGAILKGIDNVFVDKVGIVNLLTGQYLESMIPVDYDWSGLLDYLGNLIADDRNGVRIRESLDISVTDQYLVDSNHLSNYLPHHITQSEPVQTIIDLDNEKRSGYMIIDVENNTTNNDLIQLAYLLFDNDNKEIKRVNHFVADRVVDQRAGQITGITNKYLVEHGIDLKIIMKEFLTDLNRVEMLCGHHLHTDCAKIKLNMERYHIIPSYDIFDHIKNIDTASLYRQLTNKSGKLGDIYKELFGKEIKNAHDALSDCRHTAECYVELKKRVDVMMKDKQTNIMKVNKTPKKKPEITKHLIDSKESTKHLIDSKESTKRKITMTKKTVNKVKPFFESNEDEDKDNGHIDTNKMFGKLMGNIF